MGDCNPPTTIGAVTDISYMFGDAIAFNQPIGECDTGAATKFEQMFFVAKAFNQPLAEWDIGAVTDISYMFGGAIAFNQPIAEWNTSSVTSFYSSEVFKGATLMLADYSCPADGPPSNCTQ